MAKAKTLAALAGLAGLAYAMNKKGSKDDAGDQKTSSYTGDTKKVEATDEPRRQITDYMKKAPEAEDANYGNEGRRTSMGVAPAPKTRNIAAPKLETYTTRKDPREAEAGMSRGTRPADPRNLEAGMSRGRRMASGGMTASSRADGIATKGKTCGKMC